MGGGEMIRKDGFVVAEFLVLVVLLSILAVVVPSVSGAGEETRSSALVNSLLISMRSKIELYKLHHNGQLPAARGENFANFLHRMAKKTNSDGDPGVEFGPYLQSLPVNPFNDSVTVRIDGAAAGANMAAWRFDTMTGAFQADDSPDHSMF
jgi:competence protein ComGC